MVIPATDAYRFVLTPAALGVDAEELLGAADHDVAWV